MQIQKIDSFPAFCTALREAGFSIGGRNDEGIFSLSSYFSEILVEHTGNAETDPWTWRIRGITECNDLAYSKLFFNKGGWIAKEWYPYFMAVRRKHKTFSELYNDGLISGMAKSIYDLVAERPHLSLHELKTELEIGKSQNSRFESAVTELQMKMLITISGEKYKLSKEGKEYGWPVTTFCTAEEFFGSKIFDISCQISQQEAADKITEQILALNPNADTRAIPKFIGIK